MRFLEGLTKFGADKWRVILCKTKTLLKNQLLEKKPLIMYNVIVHKMCSHKISCIMIIRHLSNDNTKSHLYLFLLFFPTNVLISHLIKFLFSFVLKVDQLIDCLKQRSSTAGTLCVRDTRLLAHFAGVGRRCG